MKCPHCNNERLRKRGSMKTKRGVVQRFECKACHKTFTQRTGSLNYRHRKQDLRTTITELYCEGMSLRAIARVLKIHKKTVTKYFLENAQVARTKNLKALDNRDIVTTYIQFDELETFEHTRRKPLGVFVSIRAKTGEIISTKVCKGNIRALSISKEYIQDWNTEAKLEKQSALTDLLLELSKVANRAYTTIACDGYQPQVNFAEKFFNKDKFVNVQVLKSENKRIDLAILKLRQDISRLKRKTLATTKKSDRLQKHLDLYTDYHNKNRVVGDKI